MLFIYLLLAFGHGTMLQGANLNVTAYNSTDALAIINQSLAYINIINQSGYLVFLPNLKSSYSYIAKAKEVYNKTPSVAVAYAYRAEELARYEYAGINRYKLISLIIMTVITIGIGIWLYSIMRPMGIAAKGAKR